MPVFLNADLIEFSFHRLLAYIVNDCEELELLDSVKAVENQLVDNHRIIVLKWGKNNHIKTLKKMRTTRWEAKNNNIVIFSVL